MANFSFDYGNAHWTVLDANATVDWTDRELQEWVAKDLERSQGGQLAVRQLPPARLQLVEDPLR